MCYQLQYKEAEGSSYREGSFTETPGTPKVWDQCFNIVINHSILYICFGVAWTDHFKPCFIQYNTPLLVFFPSIME